MRSGEERELLDAEGLDEVSVAQSYRQLRMVHGCLGDAETEFWMFFGNNGPPGQDCHGTPAQ
jgi:hypothetical protein